MRVYLFVYDDRCDAEEGVLAFLDEQPLILNWETCLPSSVFLVSRAGLDKLTDIFGRRFRRGMFVISEVGNINGLLPDEMWEFINHPEEA